MSGQQNHWKDFEVGFSAQFEGDWRLEKSFVTPVGLGLCLKRQGQPCQITREPLFDLLFTIREIAIQADLLMPLVVSIKPEGNEANKEIVTWRRQQEHHKADFLLLPPTGNSQELLKDLLYPVASDIQKITPSRTVTLNALWDQSELEKTLSPECATVLINWRSRVEQAPAGVTPKTSWRFWQRQWDEMLRAWDGFQVVDESSGQQTTPEEDIEVIRSRPDSIYNRITSAKIEHFKGIKDSSKIDLDADIILVTGANGNGKSSFVEALSMALTGYHPAWKPDKNVDHFFFYGEKQFKVVLEMQVSGADKGQDEVSLVGNRKKRTLARKPALNILRREISESGVEAGRQIFIPANEELNFRMTTYLPDFVRLLFDEEVEKDWQEQKKNQEREKAEQGDGFKLLRQLFPVMSPAVEALAWVVDARLYIYEKQQKEIKKAIEKLEQFSSAYPNLLSFFSELETRIRSLPHSLARQYRVPIIPKTSDLPAFTVPEMLNSLKKTRKSLGVLFDDDIREWKKLDEFMIQHGKKLGFSVNKKKKVENLERQIQSLQEEIESLSLRIVDLEKGVALDSAKSLMDVLVLLSQSEIRDRFLQDIDALVLTMKMEAVSVSDLAKECQVVDPGKAGIFAELLQNILERADKGLERLKNERRQKKEERAQKQKMKESLKESGEMPKEFEEIVTFLKTKESETVLADLDNFGKDAPLYEDDKNRLEDITKKEKDLRQLKEIIEQHRADVEREAESDVGGPSFHKVFEQTMNQVLRRFALADGIDEVTLDARFRITAKDSTKKIPHADRRSLDCFSAGQKAQLATAWLVASRELAQHENSKEDLYFPHRILIMDDPSTTFDTTNLISQAILWRQLAYNPDPEQRYQIFIVSHHEEFSSHLLDLLCPPNGYTMKLLRFTNWTSENGAEVQLYDVEQTPENMKEAKENFRYGLECLKEMYERAAES